MKAQPLPCWSASWSLLSALALLLSSPGLRAEGKVNVLSTPSGGEVPDAEMDAAGVIHLAYVKGQDAYYTKSSDHGKTFAPAIRINSEPGTVHPPNMFRGPDLAVGKDGRVHVAWYVNAFQRKLPKEEWGVFYAHLDTGSTSFSKSQNLNHKPSDNYSLAASQDGTVAVVWMAGKLFANLSRDNGETFAESEQVSVADPCECCASRALFAQDGSLLISYREKANNMRDMHLLTRAKGQTGFSKARISSTPWQINACPMTGTFLSASGADKVMAWETRGQISYARLGQQSLLTAPKEIKVAAKGKWPLALLAEDGSVLVSWKDGGTLFWQLRDRNDKAIGEVQSETSSNRHRHAGVVQSDGTFLLFK